MHRFSLCILATWLGCTDPGTPGGAATHGGAGGGSAEGGGGALSAGADGGGGRACLADISSDPANCGHCGSACAAGLLCEAGACICGSSQPVSFVEDVAPIFAARCTSGMCHANGSGALGLELGAGKAYDSLVGVPSPQCQGERMRVLPADAGASYLLDKLAGARLCSGKQMPGPGGMPEDEVRRVVDWVCSGAARN